MASIRKRKTTRGRTRYLVEIRRKGLRPVYKSFSSKEAAEVFVRETERELDMGLAMPSLEAGRHTVAEALDRYLEDHLSEVGPSDRRNRRRHLKFWKDHMGDLALSLATPAAISDGLRILKKRTVKQRMTKDGKSSFTRVKAGTVNRYLASLSRVFSLASREWLWMPTNPAARLNRLREAQGRVRFLSDDERKNLLDSCRQSNEQRLYAMVLVSLATGARRGELLGLRWSDIDLQRGRATLHETKSGERRALMVTGSALAVLRGMNRTPHISGFVFANPTGNPTFPRKRWVEALETAKIEDFRWHDLRHTAASYLAMSGATLAEIAGFLGHKTLAMVKRYAHLAESHSERVAERMTDEFLS